MQDLTPTHTELQTLRTFHAQHEIDVLLDASFAAYGYRVCECGSCLEPPAAVCHACLTGNRKLGPLYGGSLAGPQVQVVYTGKAEPLPYPLEDEPPCPDCVNLRTENSDLARQVVSLKGHLEELTAQVRQGKLGGGGLGDATT